MIKALLFFMMFYVGVCAADRPFTLVFSESYAPLSWQVDGEMRGVMIDVLNEALAQQMPLLPYPQKQDSNTQSVVANPY